MSYPQPDSTAPVRNGQNFFRLNTPMVSPGDLYVSEVGAGAFAIGPESDFANVAINYYDKAQPGFMNSVIVSSDRPFVGTVGAFNDSSYQPSNTPGRILIHPTDLYNPLLPVQDIVGVDFPIDETFFIAPQIDVVQYFDSPPSVFPARVDKTFMLQRALQNPAGDPNSTAAIIVPVYGRRTISYRFQPITAGNPSLFGLVAVNFAVGDINGYAVYAPDGTGPFVVPPIQQVAPVNGVIDTKTFGRVDALIVILGGNDAGKFVCRIDVSDQAP